MNKVYEVGQVFPLLLAGREHPWVHLLDSRVYRQPFHPRRSHYNAMDEIDAMDLIDAMDEIGAMD